MLDYTDNQKIILKFLLDNNLSRKELAQKLGVNKRTVDTWLMNSSKISYRTIPQTTLLLLETLQKDQTTPAMEQP